MAAEATHQAVVFISQVSCGLGKKKKSLVNNKIIIRIIIKRRGRIKKKKNTNVRKGSLR